MPETMQHTWERFAVGKRGASDCQPLGRTSHVTHVETALEVLRVGQIRPKLVLDGSRLDTKRVEVIFTSPYDWAVNGRGSIFGNVAFQLDWSKLTKGMRFYWLGAKEYKRLRPRILITSTEYRKFKPYVAEDRTGPWWFRESKDEHYWNGEYCIEFMVEGGIPLHRVMQMRFVEGHSQHCLLKTGCPNKGHDRQRAAARLLAGACSRNALPKSRDLWVWRANEPRGALRYSWSQLRNLLVGPKQRWEGPVRAGESRAKPLAWSVLGAVFQQEAAKRKELLSLFRGRKSAIESCASLIEDELQLGEGTLSRE